VGYNGPVVMKAILLAGGKGTRLRPLTLHTPKPIVPVFGRAFLNYQIDLVRQVREIDEVVLSLNYQPRRIEEVFGDGRDVGIKMSYVVEPNPLGTGGAIKFATGSYQDTIVVFNGDVMTQIDLAEVIRLHRERKAAATIVLTPVENPAAYGLVETDADGNVRRFLEKPKPEEITCDTINAGVYVLEPGTFDRIPKDTALSIERSFFPSLVERGEAFVAYVYPGYWIDIGTPEKYVQVHKDIMDRRFLAEPFGSQPRGATAIGATARIEEGARIDGPCFIDEGTVVKSGAHVRPYSVIGRNSVIEEDAVVDGAIVWPNGRISRGAVVRRCILGRHCHVGRDAVVDAGTVLGDKSAVTDFSRLTTTL
jgi:mannose-1-phosphate guanylyltransferase